MSLLSVDIDINGLRTEFHADALDDAVTIRRVQDVEPILEHNKALHSLNDGYTPSRDIRRVASIPLSVVEDWMKEGVNIFDPNCTAAIRRKLNDPQYLYLRTAPGRV